MSILTICFHAVKRSIKMSDGLSSWGAVFFLICCADTQHPARLSTSSLTKDWFLETVDPAREVVRDTVSKWDIVAEALML
jgi:hypothetical protein